jgi:diaminopropionate ammonia-lyase
MTIATSFFDVFLNPSADRKLRYAGDDRETILSLAALDEVRSEITTWTGYHPTPLVSLAGLADVSGVARIDYKDEGSRFGLGSFKALGGAYAVFRLLQGEVVKAGYPAPASRDLLAGKYAAVVREMTVTCATDGNHGRSVAWGARLFGCRAVIYIHETVSKSRESNIAQYGAEVRRVPGNYDEAVRRAATDAAANGWFVVSDTSYEGYTTVPRDVMQGYALMVDEALAQIPNGALPTHVFVQGGVGGLAASVCAYLWERLGEHRPFFVVVEPDKADCLFRSAQAGEPVVVEGALDTIMAGLACGEVSVIAWKILEKGADAFMRIGDDSAAETMRMLANTPYGGSPVVAGESAVAGLAGFLLASKDETIRRQLGIDMKSELLVIGTEGATDPEMYEKIVGRSAAAVGS